MEHLCKAETSRSSAAQFPSGSWQVSAPQTRSKATCSKHELAQDKPGLLLQLHPPAKPQGFLAQSLLNLQLFDFAKVLFKL